MLGLLISSTCTLLEKSNLMSSQRSFESNRVHPPVRLFATVTTQKINKVSRILPEHHITTHYSMQLFVPARLMVAEQYNVSENVTEHDSLSSQ
jgi:hypothetical protein